MADVAIKPTIASRRSAGEASAWEQLKTNKSWLAFWFMLPTAVFLIMFLA